MEGEPGGVGCVVRSEPLTEYMIGAKGARSYIEIVDAR